MNTKTSTADTLALSEILLGSIANVTAQIEWSKKRIDKAACRPMYFISLTGSVDTLLAEVVDTPNAYNFGGNCVSGWLFRGTDATNAIKRIAPAYPDYNLVKVAEAEVAAKVLARGADQLKELRTAYDNAVATETLCTK